LRKKKNKRQPITIDKTINLQIGQGVKNSIAMLKVATFYAEHYREKKLKILLIVMFLLSKNNNIKK
jgi:hypothetical protein